ncbi:MAG: hypothetical protein NTV88_03075 [Candidatus Micrarchaeota archaeon]|nr:hypothetical protein [Candidatus Micrarchaeota archaeon]
MNGVDMKNLPCKFAIPKDGGGLFWQTGILEDENTTHYFFKINGQLVAYRRSDVIKIEFLTTQAGGRV